MAFANFSRTVNFEEVEKLHKKQLSLSERQEALNLAWKNMTDE